MSYWADRPSAEVTAIAWSWNGEKTVHCRLLGVEDRQIDATTYAYEWVGSILLDFFEAYCQADIVTGHYIKKHDLPIVNGACIENSLLTLGPKLASDTKLDLVKRHDLPVSQEALSAYLEIKAPKVQMTQADWRDANRLTATGLERTYKRVVGDVKQHKALRAELLRRGLLKAPKVWTP